MMCGQSFSIYGEISGVMGEDDYLIEHLRSRKKRREVKESTERLTEVISVYHSIVKQSQGRERILSLLFLGAAEDLVGGKVRETEPPLITHIC